MIVFLVLLFLIVICNTTSAGAAQTPSWLIGAPTVVKNVPSSGGLGGGCAGYTQDRMISELQMKHEVCLFGDDRMGFGYFSNGGPYRAVVQLPLSNELHDLGGACNGTMCRYSADTDMLVMLQRIEQYSWGLVVYDDASHRVTRTQSINGSVQYGFDITNPSFEIKNDVGRYIATPSFALSDNGKWIVAELHNKGIAVINTENFSTRQIATAGHLYGYGMDPSEQIAVSNDGKSIIVTGQNAGFSVIEVAPGCGQELIGDLSPQSLAMPCGSTDLGIGTTFPNFHSAEQPRFFGSGHQLEVVVNSWVQGSRRVTFLANGAPTAHKLKLLALGDSFISGEGETDDEYYQAGTNDGFDRCHISKRSYPLLVAGPIGIGLADAKSVACSGARISDISGSVSDYWGQGNRLGSGGLNMSATAKLTAQEEAVENFQPGRTLQSAFLERYNPEKIMIGVGGNDAGLMGKLRTCVMPGTCEWANGEGMKATANEIRRLFDGLVTLFSRISSSHSDAQVFVAGYPNIIEVDGSCDPITGVLLNRTERLFVNRSVEYMNQIIRAATKKAGFTYIDVQDSLVGRQLCSSSNLPAMNGIRAGDDISISSALPLLKIIGAETFHPTPIGHRMIADTILAKHPGLSPDPTCATDPMACSIAAPSIEPPIEWGLANVNSDRSYYAVDFATTSNQDSRKLDIRLPDGSLVPGTEVKIEIRSRATVLGTFIVSERGTVEGSVSIPAETEPGFHTLHLLGTNREGRTVDMYQFITVANPDDAGIVQGGEVVSVDTVTQHQVSAANERAAIKNNPLNSTPAFMDVLGVTASTPDLLVENTKPPHLAPITNSEPHVEKDKKLTILGLIGLGVLVTCVLVGFLVFKRWAKPGS